MTEARQTLGALGEQFARVYLEEKGMKFLEANWRCRAGELDLLMQDGEVLVCVEVKSRRDSPWARRHLFDSITFRKKKKLRTLAEIYQKVRFRFQKKPALRIDVVGVLLEPEAETASKIQHIRAAV